MTTISISLEVSTKLHIFDNATTFPTHYPNRKETMTVTGV